MTFLKEKQQNLTDIELLILYKQSCEQQYVAQLFLRYSDLVYGCCCKYLSAAEAAKDATMSIYSQLVDKLQKQQVQNFKSWLYVLTKNYCLMELRKLKRSPVLSIENDFMQFENFEHPDDVFNKENRLNELSICLDSLNEGQKQSITLFYLENKCYQEIATITGNDWGKVRSLIQNGKRNLKRCLEKNV